VRDYSVFDLPTNSKKTLYKSEAEQEIDRARNCLNVDLAFKHSRDYLAEQLDSVDDILYQQRKSLYFKRNFELHTISEQ
jgi:hypothetical protein